ncbi:MAG: ImmA/IrrE family metallo-endopeptidase [Nitrospirales bacterium]|nr:ImmA/IrrE family metallo-endopeptidase [Nitrospirales bacterium]
MSEADLKKRFPKIEEWESGVIQPTLKQLEGYAKATHTPFGFLFLARPPEEPLPIPDFRTMTDRRVTRPSPDLLDTIYMCQQRQAWYHEYSRANQLPPVEFIGTVTRTEDVKDVANLIREKLALSLEARRQCATWEDALRSFIYQADDAGILVMCNGVVANNTHRKLDPDEFRGFALSDRQAPVIFVNGADSKSAQMFTLAHELAHLWLGETALSSVEIAQEEEKDVERWCNAVAAEVLVPLDILEQAVQPKEPLEDAKPRLARQFKVSTLVILRRLRDVGFLSNRRFFTCFKEEVEHIAELQKKGGGGNFYLSQSARASKRFTRALAESTFEGQTLYRDAMKMLGISKISTFHNLARRLSVIE